VGLLLAWPNPVTVTYRDERTGVRLSLGAQNSFPAPASRIILKCSPAKAPFDLARALSILTQALIITPDSWASWIPVSGSTQAVTIKGAVSLEPAPTKQFQFMSLGICPISNESSDNEILDEINRIFCMSRFGVFEEELETDEAEKRRKSRHGHLKQDERTNKHPKSTRKRIDRWPMFCLCIAFRGSDNTDMLASERDAGHKSKLRVVIEVLDAMLTRWLGEHHFRPQRWKKHQEKSKDFRQGHDALHTNDQLNVITQRVLRCDASCRPSSPSVSEESRAQSCGATFDVRKSKWKRSPNRPSTCDASTRSTNTPRASGMLSRAESSAFSTWTRIKSGNSKFYEQISLASPSLPKPVAVRSTSKSSYFGSSPNPCTSASSATTPRLPNTSHHRMISLDLPQNEILPPDSNTTLDRDSTCKNEINKTLETEDEIMPWKHPLTMEAYLINSRSGVIVPTTNRKPKVGKPNSFAGAHIDMRVAEKAKSLRLGISKGRSSNNCSSAWIGNMLDRWNNPVSTTTEEGIRQVSLKGTLSNEISTTRCYQSQYPQNFAGTGLEITSVLNTSRISSIGLRSAEVVSQLDNKFILVKLPSQANSAQTQTRRDIDLQRSTGNMMLVLIDQHAADERCKIEALLADLCRKSNDGFTKPSLGQQVTVVSTRLQKPIVFLITLHEGELLKTHAGFFARWAILYDIAMPSEMTTISDSTKNCKVTVKTLPPGISERCTAEPRLIIELLRSEAWRMSDTGRVGSKTSNLHEAASDEQHQHAWLRHIHDCPRAILEILNSRACRSAVMFNDKLSLEECRQLVGRLAECAFPFQCAHGRPSMVPLIELGNESWGELEKQKACVQGGGKEEEEGSGEYARAFKRWRERLRTRENEEKD